MDGTRLLTNNKPTKKDGTEAPFSQIGPLTRSRSSFILPPLAGVVKPEGVLPGGVGVG
tara:strand:- start:79 stop:252 length:174 start_codon:yes stop_codon:yes gene_type:complete